MFSFRSFSFPGATNETLLQKFNSVHRDNKFYEKPQKKENAFIIRHYAGKVKYQVNYVTLIFIAFIRSDSQINSWNILGILWDTQCEREKSRYAYETSRKASKIARVAQPFCCT